MPRVSLKSTSAKGRGVGRRSLLLGAAALSGVTALVRPRDRSAPRDDYFLDIQRALRRAQIAWPVLIIDRTRLTANVKTLVSQLPSGMAYRVVVKSLPSLPLLARVREVASTDRLMTFNQAMLTAVSQAMPDASQLLGKPLPVAAAHAYFRTLEAGRLEAADRVQWLIDTPERLTQYAALADAVGRVLSLSIELDVGLHRGGFVPGEQLRAALRTVQNHPRLCLAGFMGYEPHVAAAPAALGLRDRALAQAWRTYGDALEQTRALIGTEACRKLTRNAAGSPTYRLYRDTGIASEVSAGSCLVKPTDFDTDLLAAHQPAAFIATPVIKALDQTRLPLVGPAPAVASLWDPNLRKTVFIHGGHWLASPVDPPGLAYNSLFGRSSNQEMLNGGPALSVQPDDTVFLRPHQSEALFMQFGDIAVYEDGAIVDHWEVLPASA